MRIVCTWILLLGNASCTNSGSKQMHDNMQGKKITAHDTLYRTNSRAIDSSNTSIDSSNTSIDSSSVSIDSSNTSYIHTGNTTPEQIVSFAETLLNTPY